MWKRVSFSIKILILQFSGEYFLADYLMKIGNFNREYLDTVMGCEGYFDSYNIGKGDLTKQDAQKIVAFRRGGLEEVTETVTVDNAATQVKYHWYEFSFMPNIGILADPDPLMSDCELRLSFTRAKPSTAVVQIGTDDLPEIELKYVHAVTEYVSSPAMRQHFQSIETSPIIYNYDNIDVFTKQLPLNDTVVRFDHIKGGNVPSHIFAGIIPTSAITGDLERSSTGFMLNNVTEFNFSLNGSSCNGFPLVMRNKGSVVPLQQFHDVTGRLMNVESGSGFTLNKFETNFIWSHRFEAEKTAQGWIGIDFKLSELLDFNATLVVWTVSPQTLSIDKFHQIEQLEK